ncbi:MAG: hypothetical protein H0U44_06965 [Flavisolibacter sp.]|jgi:hypothetical protein|nr:hypothetical protein [Flavisolibacter sp.]
MRTFVPGVRTLVLISALALTFQSKSQSITTGNGKVELGIGIGPLFFLGDLGGNAGVGKRFIKDINFPVTNFVKGVYVNIYPAEWLGFRLAINQGTLEGYDSLIKDNGGAENYRRDRNLNFRSPLLEAYAALEFYPTVFFERYDGLQGKLRPYGVVGIGAFKFNPQGKFYHPDGRAEWVDLKPLSTEGQGMAEYPDRKPYSLISLEIPLGAGFKYYFQENFYVGLEVMHRKSFTDYVDDVSTTYIDNNLFSQYLTPSQAAMANQLYFRENFKPGGSASRVPTTGEQRGNPKQNDSYFSTIIRCGWRLNDWNSPNGRAARQMRCPAYY